MLQVFVSALELKFELILSWRRYLPQAHVANRSHRELLSSWNWRLIFQNRAGRILGTLTLTKLSHRVEFFWAPYNILERCVTFLLTMQLSTFFYRSIQARVVSHMDRTLQFFYSYVDLILEHLLWDLFKIETVFFFLLFGRLTWTQIYGKTCWLAFPRKKAKSFNKVRRCNLLHTSLNIRSIKFVLLLQTQESSSAGQHLMENSHNRAKHLRRNLLVNL